MHLVRFVNSQLYLCGLWTSGSTSYIINNGALAPRRPALRPRGVARPRARRRRPRRPHGEPVDVRGAHHHRRHRGRRAGALMERRAARLGGRPRRHGLLRRRHLRLRRPALPLLQVPRPRRSRRRGRRGGPVAVVAGQDAAELHLHGRRPGAPRQEAHLRLRLAPVPLPLRDRRRLHHHHRHLRRRDQEGQLLPRPRARRRPLHLGRPGAAPVHASLRRRAAGALLHPQLPQHGVALRRGGRHVLHLLHHRPRPRPLQDHRRRRGPRERRRRADAHPDAEGLAGVAGHRRHRVRVPVLHRAPGDTGHAAVVAAGGGDASEGERARDAGHHLLLPLRGLLRLRRLRRRRDAGEPAHRLRLLRALLARRLRQRLHRAPHPRRLPVLQPADLHGVGPLAGGAVPGQRVRVPDLRREAGAGPAAVRAEPAADVLPDGVRGEHDGAGRGVPLLQRGAGPAGRAHLLAAHHLPPSPDVLRAAPGPGVDAHVGRAPGIQRRMLRRRHLRLRRLRPGRHPEETRLFLGRHCQTNAHHCCTCTCLPPLASAVEHPQKKKRKKASAVETECTHFTTSEHVLYKYIARISPSSSVRSFEATCPCWRRRTASCCRSQRSDRARRGCPGRSFQSKLATSSVGHDEVTSVGQLRSACPSKSRITRAPSGNPSPETAQSSRQRRLLPGDAACYCFPN